MTADSWVNQSIHPYYIYMYTHLKQLQTNSTLIYSSFSSCLYPSLCRRLGRLFIAIALLPLALGSYLVADFAAAGFLPLFFTSGSRGEPWLAPSSTSPAPALVPSAA